MLHDIGNEVYRCEFTLARPAQYNSDYLMIINGEQIALKGEDKQLPLISDIIPQESFVQEDIRYLFSISGRGFYLYLKSFEASEDVKFYSIHALRQVEPRWMAFAGVTAYHLAYWYSHNRFCGACGRPFSLHEKERALICHECGNIKYPDMSVAIIAGVTWGDKLLLSRYAGRPVGSYALIAGFGEIGESLEAVVRREVMEETGLKVKNIRYFDNQPWGFSRSTLVGFFADLDGSPEITVDTTELAEAKWVDRADVPCPEDISLTAKMMAAFHNNHDK